ncbi:hypothetical protein ASC95_08660 [Pelomonas sp. Root1217]|uniref:hypothetical protein n=1 Tax=Pelomonas sp. Root1217 TaxID=1736430 RepID=UPI00070E6FB2|nr:hypothetical protein [Pelomonas sp. Root1217]KQV52860.1 hypothetical protein ASC95_08660 [Pelomonas sp. Root1217]
MSALDILRRITKPMTDAESVAMVRTQYGVGRENVSNGDLVAVQRAREVLARRTGKNTTVAVNAIKVKGARSKGVTVGAKAKPGIKKLRAAR